MSLIQNKMELLKVKKLASNGLTVFSICMVGVECTFAYLISLHYLMFAVAFALLAVQAWRICDFVANYESCRNYNTRLLIAIVNAGIALKEDAPTEDTNANSEHNRRH